MIVVFTNIMKSINMLIGHDILMLLFFIRCFASYCIVYSMVASLSALIYLQFFCVHNLQVLFEAKQWDYLVDQFKQEFCKLYGMTLEPLLNIYLQAGLSALKTPYPY